MLFLKTDTTSRVALGIGVDQKRPLLSGGEASGEIYGSCCFSDATFLVGDRDDSRHVLWKNGWTQIYPRVMPVSTWNRRLLFHVETSSSILIAYRPGTNFQRVSTSTPSISSPGLIGVSAWATPATRAIIKGRGCGGLTATMLISINVPSDPPAARAATSASARAFSIALPIAVRRAA